MRLIVVDDDRLVVDSLKIILGAQPQIEVVGTGADGNDAAGGARRKCRAGPACARPDFGTCCSACGTSTSCGCEEATGTEG